MRPVDSSQCQVHVLVCVNARETSSGMPSCGPLGGEGLYFALKGRLATLAATHWVTRTGCLGFCNPVGTTVVVIHRGEAPRWYTEVTSADLDSLLGVIVRK